jgi:hypothetical protein
LPAEGEERSGEEWRGVERRERGREGGREGQSEGGEEYINIE